VKEKLCLRTVRRESGLSLEGVAQEAGISLTTEYLAEIGVAIDVEDARRILTALSHVAGEQFTLETVHIVLKNRGEKYIHT